MILFCGRIVVFLTVRSKATASGVAVSRISTLAVADKDEQELEAAVGSDLEGRSRIVVFTETFPAQR